MADPGHGDPNRGDNGQEGPKNGNVLKGVLKSLRTQSLVALALVLISLPAGVVAAYSSLLGSLAVYIPGLLFTVAVMRKMGGDSAVFLRTAALAEFGKLGLTAVLCAVVFIWVKPLAAGFFFLGMMGVLIAGWIGLAVNFRE